MKVARGRRVKIRVVVRLLQTHYSQAGIFFVHRLAAEPTPHVEGWRSPYKTNIPNKIPTRKNFPDERQSWVPPCRDLCRCKNLGVGTTEKYIAVRWTNFAFGKMKIPKLKYFHKTFRPERTSLMRDEAEFPRAKIYAAVKYVVIRWLAKSLQPAVLEIASKDHADSALQSLSFTLLSLCFFKLRDFQKIHSPIIWVVQP